ncbi:diguanylate cyclase [Novosphingobium sp. 9U]|uniref:GGDEF domain-containing protein n=1 Tax=Novosphingobium sp. 9U TaxID=2653158 RepID=UPI0012F0CAC6|nr:GGDEF domain-containing protein [Novosphingobium sp. 9U]VWX54039.1 putative Diguanylate cyclase [Novosphingobium sp. 9U]
MRAVAHVINGLLPCCRTIAVACVLICSSLASVEVAHAGCMDAPTKELRQLAELAGQDPGAVLARTARDAPASLGTMRYSWRQAARAEAYDTLSRPADARRTALRLLKGELSSNNPLRVELLTRFAINGFNKDEIDSAVALVERARQGALRGSAADACLQIALGEMQRMRGAPERAVVYLAEAYRATSDRRLSRQHVIATEKLARVVDWAGDHLQAISLIGEVIDWDQARKRMVALSTDFYFRGVFNLGRGAFQAALTDFNRSRALAPAGVDPVGSAFLDLQTCSALIELRALNRARAACQRAEVVFGRYGELAQAQARLLLARISNLTGEHKKALDLLNGLLAKADALSASSSAPEAFRLRSDVNQQLGRTAAAYRDLNIYVRGIERQRASEQMKQNAVLRARLDADRAVARNEELRQKLDLSATRERERAKRESILAGAAFIGLLLVLIILGMSFYHRRKLTRIANTDPLTGLLNRRFVSEHESLLVSTHTKTGDSLALAIVDIDHFKAINDTYGHDGGDQVLVAFADVARGALRKDDVIARWGGEEFLVIFPRASEAEAVGALFRVKDALAAGVSTAGGVVPVKFSVGIVCCRTAERLHTLVQRADEALYRAKAGGRDRIEIAELCSRPVTAKDTLLLADDRRIGAAA